MRSIGVNVKDYQASCDKLGIELFKYPIIEMAPPEDLAKFHSEVIEKVLCVILSNKGNVLVHCRGGVGRAGTLACCVLSNVCTFTNHKKVIEYVRKRRDKRCVESKKQEDFVKAYFNLVN
jgi:cyclin-dependent kinase inhibitor 3